MPFFSAGRPPADCPRFAYALSGAVLLLALCFPINASAQSGTVIGRVTDADTGEPLTGATIRIADTGLGTASDLEGNYSMTGVPAGDQTLIASYIGYAAQEIPVVVVRGEIVTQDVQLEYGVVEGQEVVVTAQLEGQARAINQQISSNTIVNVVSSDRLQELPDANAAESVGRLPGISLQRNAGEGQKVVVRGLSPRFNSITINGQRIPATDLEDRSVDLSMISPDVLAGIEVFKALTPDMDGDAIGGTVNFVTRGAPEGFRGTFDLQSGYNGLINAVGQYKASLNLSNRFLDNRLGVLASGTFQRADRSSDRLNAGYGNIGGGPGSDDEVVVVLGSVTLDDRFETRDRYSASVALDYDLGAGHSINLNTLYGKTFRNEERWRKNYSASQGYVNTEYLGGDSGIDLINTSLRGRHLLFQWADLDWQATHSATINRRPDQLHMVFRQASALSDDFDLSRGPADVPAAARENLDITNLLNLSRNATRVVDRDLTFESNLLMPYTISRSINGYVKIGGKYADKNRRRGGEELAAGYSALNVPITDAFPGRFDTNGLWVTLRDFLETDQETDDFLNGDFDAPLRVNRDLAWEIADTLVGRDALRSSIFARLGHYRAQENVRSGYVMTELNLGRRITLLPGVRYENTINDYFGHTTDDIDFRNPESGTLEDSTGGQRYGDFLPMVHLRVNMASWMDLRLAVTKTLARPDFYNMVPYQSVDDPNAIVRRGNPQLKHTTSWNYDAFLSFYPRGLGLFTVGGYYKQLDNIDYILRISDMDLESEFFGYSIIEPVNSERTTTVYGAEFDLQTNLRFLPSPLDGIVLNLNYSVIRSEAFFPYFDVVYEPPNYRAEVIRGYRSGTMPGQTDQIANVSFGYEKGGFSGRVSATYQGAYLTEITPRREMDPYTNEFLRWDASMRQNLGQGLMLFLNMNNISNVAEGAYMGKAFRVTNEEYYGWTADLGVRYRF